jgi:hypothetical protein
MLFTLIHVKTFAFLQQICYICTQNAIDIATHLDVDVRELLVASK